MKPSECTAAAELLVEANVPFHIEGEPGVGKTSIITQLGKKLKRDVKIIRLADHEPSDFQMPRFKGDDCEFIVPKNFLPKPDCGPTILFFDEWRQGFPQTQNVAGRLLNERCLGNYRLSDKVYICAASNRAKDRAATNRMPSHIASRFNWLTMESDPGDWCRWAIDTGIETELIGFIRWRSNLLSAFDPMADVSPTCRAWERVDSEIKALKKRKTKLPIGVEERIYAGDVGNGAAAELMGFLEVFRDLPDPAAMLMSPDTCEIPTKPATLCAICTTLARKATDTNFDRIVRLGNRMDDEYSVLMITQAVGIQPSVQKTRAFMSWAERYQDALS